MNLLTVWLRCPKHKFNGSNIVRYAAASAVIQFNGGSSMASRVMQTLGTPASSMAIENFRKKHMERAKLAEKASDEKERKKRTVMKQLRTAREEAYKEAEGGLSYDAGAN